MDLSILKKVVIEIPLPQLGIFVGLCTIAALIGKLKFLLLFIYGFVLYWVFFLNEPKFGFSESASLLHTGLFILSSIIFVGCSAWVLFIER